MNQDPSVLAGTSYRLGKKIGEGSSGEVYEAEHTELARRYAVKVLSSAHAAAHDSVERFRREARAIASLSHPNLVRLHDFGKSLDGRVFLVMELLEGQTLDMHADLGGAGKGLPWREATRLAIQVARALEAAHDAGLVHRDLKPQNLFLTRDGELKLLDFGVAMALADTTESDKRQKGFAVFGTPEYMAPEQVAGEPVDARCDLYALGCVLYELVTGVRPFQGSPVVVMGKQLREIPERPRARMTDATLPAEIEEVILKALAKSKHDRFPTARAMREALETALAAPDKRKTRARRAATVAIAGALGMLAVALLKGHGGAAAPAVADHAQQQQQQTAPAAAPAPVEVPAPPSVVVAEAEPAAPVAKEAPVTPRRPEPARTPKAEAQAAPARATHGAVASASASGEGAAEEHGDEPSAPKSRDDAKDGKDGKDGKASLLTRASARHGEGDAKARLEDARLAAKEHTSDAHALRGWATAALAAGEVKEARRAAEAWAAHDAGVEPRLFLAGALEAGGRRREARAILEEWLANHPETPDVKKMRERLGASPEPAIKRNGRARQPAAARPAGHAAPHAAETAADGE
jgi:serine/threonine-protein kinase